MLVYPDRSTDGFEKAISGFPNEVDTPRQKEEWILEMTKMSILAENKLQPTNPQLVQNAVAKIDDMVTHLCKPLSDEEFINLAREKYGYRGARDAKEMLESFDTRVLNMSKEDNDAYRQLMIQLWIDSKEEAREKYTPKKYRKK